MGWEVRGFSTHSFTSYHFPTCLLVFLSFLLLKECSSFPNGLNIPSESCKDMRPKHGNHDDQGPDRHPFRINPLNKTFGRCDLITFQVSTNSSDCFTGIYAQVRPQDSEDPVGHFPPHFNPNFLRPIACNNRNRSTITQVVESRNLCEVNLTWRAPSRITPDITNVRLVVTIVQSFEKFWVQLKSPPVPVARETFARPNVDEIRCLDPGSTTSTTVPTLSTWTDSDNKFRTSSTEAGSYDETSSALTYSDNSSTEHATNVGSSKRMPSSQSSESKYSSEPTERPVKTEAMVSMTRENKQSSSTTSRPFTTRSPPPRSSESIPKLETTELKSYSTHIEPDDATTTLQTDYHRSTEEAPINVMSTEDDDDEGNPSIATRFPKPTKGVTSPATTKYESSSVHMDTAITNTVKPSAANNKMSTSLLTTSSSSPSVFLITTSPERSTTNATTKEAPEATDRVTTTTEEDSGTTDEVTVTTDEASDNITKVKTTTKETTPSTPSSTTEGIVTTTLDQTQTEGSLTSLTIQTNDTSKTPMRTLTPSSFAETKSVTTEKDSTTPTPNGFTNLVVSSSPEATDTDIPVYKSTFSPGTTNTKEILTAETSFTDIYLPKTDSTSQENFSTLKEDELTTFFKVLTTLTEEFSTEIKEMKSTTLQQVDTTTSSTETISTIHSLTTQAIPSTSPLATSIVPSTKDSTTQTFPSTIDHTTQFYLSTNPSTTPMFRPTTALETVSDSTDVVTETNAITSPKRTSESLTTLVDKTSASSSTQKLTTYKSSTRFTTQQVDTTTSSTETIPPIQSLTTQEILSTSPLATSIVPSTTESTTQTFPTTIDLTTQFYLSTNPSTTPMFRPTTAGKTVSDSTDVVTETNASTSPKHTSEPLTGPTTLVDNTSASSSTQKLTTYKSSTRSTTETLEPTSEEDHTTEEAETTQEDATPMDNKTEGTVTPTNPATPTPVTTDRLDRPITPHTGSPSTARVTENVTVSTQNVTTVNGTNLETTTTPSTPSTRSTTEEVTSESTTPKPDTSGTEIVMVFEIDNYAFNISLTDPDSEYYKKLSNGLASAVENVYRATNNKPTRVGARNFTSGSVIAEMSTVYERTLSEDEMTDAVLVMFEHVNNDMFSDSFDISDFWISDESGNRIDVDPCFGTQCPPDLKCNVVGNRCFQNCSDNPTYCNQNGGCQDNPENATIACECVEGFSGERCDITVSVQPVVPTSNDVTLAVILGVLSAGLLILIVILMFGMVFLLRTTKSKPSLPTSMDNSGGIPQFPMISLNHFDNISIPDSNGNDDFDTVTITSDHPSITEDGGVRFSHLPDLITSASSIPDWEHDVVSNPNRRRRTVSFNDIREVLEADDTVSIETFSFGASYLSRENDNGQIIFRWRPEWESSSSPTGDEAPT